MAILTLHEAARVAQGVPRTVSSRESHQMPDVHRTQKELQKQALLWDKTKGRLGLQTIVEGKKRRKVHRKVLDLFLKARDVRYGIRR